MSYLKSVHAKAAELTRLALEMTAEAGSGHPTSAASLAHIVTVLMFDRMRFDPAEPDALGADRLVLSEGHACPIVYAAAADLGIVIGRGADRRPMSREDAMRLRDIDSAVDGHPNPELGFPFFPAATGSLGQGLSVAAGLAIAARIDDLDRRVYCILGDGESREGQVWEAADLIAERGLRAVCPIFNCNGYGQTGAVSPQQSPETLASKLRAFGFDVEILDGHDPEALRDGFNEHAERADAGTGRPFALVARTTKGWGSESLQGPDHHGKPATGDALTKALRELDATRERLGAAGPSGVPGPRTVEGRARTQAENRTKSPPPTLDAALEAFDRSDELEGGKLATRDAFGVALRALGHSDPRIVVLDGDVADSTRAGDFADDPDLSHRFIQCRIAEQNMVSCAAGLSAGGKTPFVTTFGKFLTRAYDQLEMSLIGGEPLKLCGSHTGVSLAADGPSQMALPDVAFFRAFAAVCRDDDTPLMHVLNPCDARSAYALTLAMARHDGAVYLRTMRPKTPLLYASKVDFRIGGFHLIEPGADGVIAAWGYMVHAAKKAHEELARRGIHVALIDAYSIPFDTEAFVAEVERGSGRVLTVEDNYGGGLGSEVADALAAAGSDATVQQMFVRSIPKSGREPEDVLNSLGLSSERIVERVERMLSAER